MKIILYLTLIFFFKINSYAQKSSVFINSFVINGKIILTDVSINESQEKFNFIFDTGSSNSTISKRAFDKLGLNIYDSLNSYDGLKTETTYQTIINLSLNQEKIERLKIDVIDFSSINEMQCEKIDGIIGGDIIKQYVWSIQKDSIFIAHKIKAFNANSYQKFKISSILYDTPIIIAGFLNDYSATMLFDTGDNTLIAIAEEQIKNIDIINKTRGIGTVYSTVFGNKCIDTTYYLKPKSPFLLYYSDFYINNVYVDMNHDDLLSSIGIKIFDYFDILLDYKKKQIYFKQINKNYIKEKEFGFKWKVHENNNVFITFLWNNSPAYYAGLKLGMQIINVNNIDVNSNKYSKCEIYQLIRSELNKKQEITIKVKESSKEYLLKKTDWD